MVPGGRKLCYFRYILLTFGILMVLEFSLNIFGFASFQLNSSHWRQFNATQFLEAGGGGGGGGGGDGEGAGGSSIIQTNPSQYVAHEDSSSVIDNPDSPQETRTRNGQTNVDSDRRTVLRQTPSSTPSTTTTTTITTTTSTTPEVLLSKTTTTTTITTANILSLCPEPPPKLVGLLRVVKKPIELSVVELHHGIDMAAGGFFSPSLLQGETACLARHKVAIIIPFRDRDEHLHIFLNHLLPILKRQLLEFQIYVVDLVRGVKFNRAMLMNIGYKEAVKEHDWGCFVFHDVDLLPENDKNIYSCPEKPRHMSAAVDTMHYKLPYSAIFGGVSALTREQFEKINGFSNRFFGWGGEDDDIFNRIKAKGYKISRYPMAIARYSMITHKKDAPNPSRFKLLNSGVGRMSWDGINSLKYKLIEVDKSSKLFTRILVSIDEKEVMALKGPSLN